MPDVIACHLHDYIETACLFGYEVKLELKQQADIKGRAVTTETSADKKEWLILEIDNRREKIELTCIIKMRAITKNQYFDVIDFS